MKLIIDFLRRFKPSYTVFNFFNQNKLRHNSAGYKKFGLRRALYKPLETSIFSKIGFSREDLPWLDRFQSIEALEHSDGFESLDSTHQDQARFWHQNGYLILDGFFDAVEVDSINLEIDRLLESGKISFKYGNKIMFANKVSNTISGVSKNLELREILSRLLGMKVLPFQTINFIQGSEQKAHSDSVHMTTFPPGYLIAVWIALEDIAEDQGPLFYFPGSHRYEYLMKPHYESGDSKLLIGDYSYNNYERAVEDVIKSQKPSKMLFKARKGDVLIWHANLLHGGEPILRKGSTRKSMVIHYFGTDAIKYHEITGRPALIDSEDGN